jgi:nicotinate-nucleotide adenylyltransferase
MSAPPYPSAHQTRGGDPDPHPSAQKTRAGDPGPRVGILGGTLDPVHVGHVETALAARRALALDRVLIVPSHVPPHKRQIPVASPYHRFAMTALAVNGIDGLEASDVELSAPGPSYTANTLDRLLATGLRASQIFFITGADAFAEIATWSRYPEVLDLSNFIVVSRPGFASAALPAALPRLADRMIPARAGRDEARLWILLVDSATPDVSSTQIRRRLESGETIQGLVPAAVEKHIRQHGLYSVGMSTILQSTADHLHGHD